MRMLISRPALLFFGALLVYMALAKGYINVSDAHGRYSLANRMWYDSSIFLDPQDPFFLALGTRGFNADGEAVCTHGLGQSITMLPAVICADVASRYLRPADPVEFRYLAGQFLVGLFQLPFFAAISLVLLRTLGMRLGMSDRHATWTAVALGFCTLWMAYAKIVGVGVEISFFILAGLVCYTGGKKSPTRLAVSSALLGFALIYRMEFVIPVGLLMAALVYDQWRERELSVARLLHFAWPVILCGCFVMWHNYIRSGNVVENIPDQFHRYATGEVTPALVGSVPLTQGSRMFGSYPLEYLLSSLFGLRKGLFWYSPILFLLALWPLRNARGWHRAFTLGVWALAAMLLSYGSLRWTITEGGWGSRYMLPAVPFLVLAGSYGIRGLLQSRRVARALGATVVVVGISQAVLGFEGQNYLFEQSFHASQQLGGDMTDSRYSLLVGRLRNIGITFFDDESMRNAWQSEEVQSAAVKTSDMLWWLKLRGKTSSAALRGALPVAGIGLLLAGLALLFLSQSPRTETRRLDRDVRRRTLTRGPRDALERGT